MTKRPFWIYTTLSLTAIFSLLFSLMKGSTSFSVSQLFFATLHPLSISHEILFSIRLPETLTAFVVGGLLALSGALMQILLRNPLADPYVLGTSGGAALATLFFMLIGISGFALTLGAWLGSLLTISAIFFWVKNKMQTDHIILTGVAFSSVFSALISLILFLSPTTLMRGMLFWLVGDLSETSIPFGGLLILIGGFLLSIKLAHQLNILMRGEKEALSLGVNVSRLKIILIFFSTLLAATAVTLAGCIGFIGLIVPHTLRLFFGFKHQVLLPASILLGGTLLTFADALSRTLSPPEQLPVGIIMALMGIPVFLILLRKNNDATYH